MFNFKYVYDEETKRKYYINSATLANDVGYLKAYEDSNMFDIDLQPTDTEGLPLFNICLVVCNNGEVNITRGLLKSNDVLDESGNSRVTLQACITYEDAIIVSKK